MIFFFEVSDHFFNIIINRLSIELLKLSKVFICFSNLPSTLVIDSNGAEGYNLVVDIYISKNLNNSQRYNPFPVW